MIYVVVLLPQLVDYIYIEVFICFVIEIKAVVEKILFYMIMYKRIGVSVELRSLYHIYI